MAVVLNPEEQNKDQQQVTNPAPTGSNAPVSSSAPAAGTSAAGAPSQARPEQKGSGRFTNIQKYLQANDKGAGRIADQIGSGFQKDFTKNTEQYTKYQNKLDNTQQQAQEAANRGTQFNQQLQGIGQNIQQNIDAQKNQQLAFNQRNEQQLDPLNQQLEQFTQSPDFNDFRNIQQGRAIDEDLLSLQQQRALQTAKQAAQVSQGAQQALGNEGGRFELLRKTFGGDARAGYGQGQQRLDNMLLSQGGGVEQLQDMATKQLQADQQNVGAAAKEANEVNRLRGLESGLIDDIGSTARSNEEAYMNLLQQYIDPTEKARQAEWSDVDRAIKSYASTNIGSGYKPGFTQEHMDKLGLDANMGVYNVLKGNKGAADFLNKGKLDNLNTQDVATEGDVNRYNALAKIIGDNHQKRLTGASTLGDVYTDKNLKSSLLAADDNWRTKLAKEQFSGRSWEGETRPVFSQTASGTVNDLINQGESALNTSNKRYKSDSFSNSGLREMERRDKAEANSQVIDQLQKYIDKHNYRQTLGGQRTTAIDKNPGITGGAGKGGAPITGGPSSGGKRR